MVYSTDDSVVQHFVIVILPFFRRVRIVDVQMLVRVIAIKIENTIIAGRDKLVFMKFQEAFYNILEIGLSIRFIIVFLENGSDCGFQILYTAGGGQFLPIADFSAEKGRQVCRFAPVSASELKIVVTDGHGTLKNVRID